MKKILLGMLVLGSITAFSQNELESCKNTKKSTRFERSFALLDLVGNCVYGNVKDCKSSISRSLNFGSTSNEIIQAVSDEVEKMKNIDNSPVEKSKEKLTRIFEEADKEFNSVFAESMNILISI